MLFSHLRAMDVSSCCLGDKHELLFHISTLKSLETLVLRKNELTDEGIRKLTAPLRIKKSGPLSLQTLDLSENTEVTVKSVKFLRVFSVLKVLDLSFTALHNLYLMQTVPELIEYARGRSLETVTAVRGELGTSVKQRLREKMEVETQGWAADLFNTWSLDSRHKLRRPSAPAHSKAIRFYGRSRSNVHEDTPATVFSTEKEETETKGSSLLLIHSTLMSHSTSLTPQESGVSLSSDLTRPSLTGLSSSHLVSKPQSELSSPGTLPVTTQSTWVGMSQNLLSLTSSSKAGPPISLPSSHQSPAVSPSKFPATSPGKIPTVSPSKAWQKESGQQFTMNGLEPSSAGSRFLGSEKKHEQSAEHIAHQSLNATDELCAQCADSHSCTFHGPLQLTTSASGQKSSGTGLHEGSKQISVRGKGTLKSSVSTQRPDVCPALVTARSVCSEPETTPVHDRMQKGSVCSKWKGKRDRESRCGEHSQQKKVRVGTRRDDDDLELLRQYGYTGADN
ncbi:uncharacterized protein LOC143295290 [Babylonia areolata]|uniref:uncharacterized protein LOC143295290 n=1 Tax=Babylonia areolata TaxID=304850 RepID=UPI003FD417E8